jgi:hypothetical protein
VEAVTVAEEVAVVVAVGAVAVIAKFFCLSQHLVSLRVVIRN